MKNNVILSVVVIVLVLLIVGAGVLRRAMEDGDGERGRGSGQAVAVEVEPIEYRPIREVRVFTGTLQPAREFVVAAKVGGRLLNLEVDIGDLVERGQLLARLEDDEFREEVEQARADLAVAEANKEEAQSSLELASAELERERVLRERDISSQADLDTAKARLRAAESSLAVAEATIRQREATLRAAEVRLSHTRIYATWEGSDTERVVGERYANEGGNLSANEAIVSLLRIDELRANVEVTERDYGRITVGMEGFLRVDTYPGEDFPAEVSRKSPRFAEQTRQARVELSVPNAEQSLRPGMFARVHMTLSERDEVIAVPRDAVVRRESRQGLFLVEGDEDEPRARFVEVEPGIVDGRWLEIRSPELEGRVVTLGQDQLVDGSYLRIVGEDTEAELVESPRNGNER
ncbi:MAG: efflux RND transporter periplasmic adaptor subunit [Opitutales bacterium]|nr:efflux RND transporter periplasmic adaptor subunit [Opitutales bacterium]MCH8540284.1 efflux RND transporter periplasmic adaptor subunit [Opitutales bacterium]